MNINTQNRFFFLVVVGRRVGGCCKDISNRNVVIVTWVLIETPFGGSWRRWWEVWNSGARMKSLAESHAYVSWLQSPQGPHEYPVREREGEARLVTPHSKDREGQSEEWGNQLQPFPVNQEDIDPLASLSSPFPTNRRSWQVGHEQMHMLYTASFLGMSLK